MKYTDGFSKLPPSIIVVLAMIGSIWLLALSMKSIPLGTAYAIWTGIGATGAAVFSMIFLGESRETLRILCILVIVAGIVGLKLFSGQGEGS